MCNVFVPRLQRILKSSLSRFCICQHISYLFYFNGFTSMSGPVWGCFEPAMVPTGVVGQNQGWLNSSEADGLAVGRQGRG